MWLRRSHMLAPLTSATSGDFEWNDDLTKSFNEVKAVMAIETLLSYPDPTKPYHIFVDASDYQLESSAQLKRTINSVHTRASDFI